MKTSGFRAPRVPRLHGAGAGVIAVLLRYGMALCIVFLASATLLIPAIRDAPNTPGLVLCLAIMLCAWSGGFGPGMFATILIVLGTLPKDLPLWRQLRLFLFVLVGALISGLMQSLQNSRRKALAQADSIAAILDASAEHIYVIDLEGRYLHVSHSAARLMGRTPEEFVGRTWVELDFSAELMEPFDAIRASVLKSGEPWQGEMRLGTSAVQRDLEYIIAPVHDQQGVTPNKVVVVARDVTDRDRAEKADVRLAAIVDSSDDAIIGKDLGGIVTSWNMGAERLFGYTAAEMVGSPIDRLIPPDRKIEEPKILEQLRRGERVNHFESIRVAKDGRMIDMSLRISPIQDSTGKVIGASKVGRDITERKATERAISERDDRTRAIVANVFDGMVTIDDRGMMVTVNPAVRRLFGYGDEELIGRNVRMLMPEPYHSEHDGYLSNYATTGVRKIIGIGREVVGLCKDGSTFPLDLSVSAFESGGSRYFVGILRDITDRKRSEEFQSRLAAIVESSDDSVVSEDLDGIIVTWNASAERIFGYTADEVIGRPTDTILISPSNPGEARAQLDAAKRGELVRNFETKRLRKNGSFVDVSVTISLIRD